MELKFSCNGSSLVVLGVVFVLGVLALRMPVEATGSAFNHMVDAVPEDLALTEDGDC